MNLMNLQTYAQFYKKITEGNMRKMDKYFAFFACKNPHFVFLACKNPHFDIHAGQLST